MATREAITFFKALNAKEKVALAKSSGIELGTLRNIFYSGKTPSIKTVLRIEKATKRKIKRQQIAPEIDWSVF